MSKVGVVVIGRNEGERLRACLRPVARLAKVVYVDSGSTDGSVDLARAMDAEVVALQAPFSPARARNEGFRRLRELAPDAAFVQFVDGDCEIDSRWIEQGARFLEEHPKVAVVSGRLRERHPERSIYNTLCDIEWDTPPGEAKACGGNAIIRAEAFEQAHGYRADVIAGEEPELCLRLRSAGWSVWQLSDEMALHDAAITRFSQWWRRTKRAGYAFAQGAALHGSSAERHWVRESRSAWFWGLLLPAGIIVIALAVHPLALALLLIYPLQIIRLALRGKRSRRENWWRALFLVLGKFPEALGQIKFWFDRSLRRRPGLIEYKQPASRPGAEPLEVVGEKQPNRLLDAGG